MRKTVKELSADTRSKIAKELRSWLKWEQIKLLHPRINLSVNDVNEIRKTSTICKYVDTNKWLMRHCNTCDSLKYYTEDFFSKDKRNKSWLWSRCLYCATLSTNNRNKVRLITEPWYKEQRRIIKTKWRIKNPDKVEASEAKRKQKIKDDPEYAKRRKKQNKEAKQRQRDKAKNINI